MGFSGFSGAPMHCESMGPEILSISAGTERRQESICALPEQRRCRAVLDVQAGKQKI